MNKYMSNLDIHNELEYSFISFFEKKGYKKLESVPISSRVDRSVYLVNSATNLFKSHFSAGHCVVAIQHCMRTQTLSDYYDEDKESQYPTTFDSYGAFVPTNLLYKLIVNSVEFFESIGFSLAKMRIRASYDDQALLSAVSQCALANCIEMDQRSEKYDHKYGNDVTGRAIKLDYYQEWQNKYKNLCYFILIYHDNIPIGAELATSDQLIIMRLQNKKYGIASSKIADVLPTNSFEERRFADSVVGTAHLLYEGLRPNSSTTNGRTLKKYISALNYFGTSLGYDEKAIINALITYIEVEYGNISDCMRETIFRSICSVQQKQS